MASEGRDEIVERRSILHAAGASHREETGNRDFTLGAPASEADLAPLYGAAQRSFRDVIGRLDSFMAEEGEESFEMLQQGQREVGDVLVAAVEIAIRQGEELLLQRNGFSDQLFACNGAISYAGSIAKTMPQTEQPGMQRQSVAAETFGVGGLADFLYAQDVAFEMRLIPRTR